MQRQPRVRGFSICVQVIEEFAILHKALSQPDAILFTEGFERLSPLWRGVVGPGHEDSVPVPCDNREASLKTRRAMIFVLRPPDELPLHWFKAPANPCRFA